VDWATGELLAYASLLAAGNEVRLSGEDVKRELFHIACSNLRSEYKRTYNRLAHLQEKQGTPYIYNSLLSEFAVLGFEYGYAMANPNNLVLWEAQYGDFANGAQTIIDQYIVSAEQKWSNMNGSCYCCLTAMKVQARTIPAHAWSASFKCARKTI